MMGNSIYLRGQRPWSFDISNQHLLDGFFPFNACSLLLDPLPGMFYGLHIAVEMGVENMNPCLAAASEKEGMNTTSKGSIQILLLSIGPGPANEPKWTPRPARQSSRPSLHFIRQNRVGIWKHPARNHNLCLPGWGGDESSRCFLDLGGPRGFNFSWRVSHFLIVLVL